MMGMSVGDLVAHLRLDSKQFDSALKSSQAKMKSFSASLGRMGSYLSFRLTLPLTYFGRRAVKSFAQFDDAINRSAAVTKGAVGKMRTEMEKTALAISKKTIISATELAEGYFALGQAGFTAAQAMSALPVITDFAVASQVELDTATRYLARSMEGLGMASDDPIKNMEAMTQVSNAFTFAAITTTAEIEDFAVAMTHAAAPALRLVNKSMEEGTSVLMAFARAGIVAEEAGTLLWTTVRDLQRANIKARNEWIKMGLEIYDVNGKMRNLGVIFGDLEKNFGNLSDQGKKVSLMMLGFQDRSLRGIQALMGFSEQMIEWQKQMEKGGDLTKEISESYLKSFHAQLVMVGHSLDVVSISIGRVLAPIIAEVNLKIQQFTNWWEKLTDHTKLFYIEIGLVLIVMGPLLIIFSKMVTMLSLLAIGLKVAGLTIGGLVTSFGVVSLAAAATLATLAIFIGTAYAVRAAWNEGLGTIKDNMLLFVDIFRLSVELLQKVWDGFVFYLPKMFNKGLKVARKELADFYKDASGLARGAIALIEGKDFWAAFVEGHELGERALVDLKKAQEDFKDGTKEIAAEIATYTLAWVEAFKENAADLGGAMKTQFGKDVTDITEFLSQKIKEMNEQFIQAMPDEEMSHLVESLKAAAKAAEGMGKVEFDTFAMHMRNAKDLMESFRGVAVRAFDSTADALTDMVAQGKLDVKDLAKTILTDLLNAVLRYRMALITEQAIQPAFAAMELQNLFMPTQASTAAATTPLQNVLTENKTYFGYATGGIAMTPQLAMVAERKPEAIIPLDDLGGIGQPPMIVINNNAGEKAPLKQGKPMRFDGKKWVVDLIIDDYTHYGDLYTLFGGK